MTAMIRVLIVDDSAVARKLLEHILAADPEVRVVGSACNGAEALEAITRHRPDVITMDINMPVMDGFAATRRIMETTPVPIVIVSSAVDPKESRVSFRAMEAGALTVLARPDGVGTAAFEAASRLLLETVKTMAGVSVVRRWSVKKDLVPESPLEIINPIDMVVIGASTGGPVALSQLLKNLPQDLPVPIAVVQHITVGFCEGFAEWLSQSSGFPVHLAQHGQKMLPGHVYIAPDGAHLGLDRGPCAVLDHGPPDTGLRPSVKHLFQSAAQVFRGRAAAILLTGMGQDGAKELLVLKYYGAITFAQDEQSSVVFGMPGEAVKYGAARYIMSPECIAIQLAKFFKPRAQPN
jgi:two-component system chemotaxis response regulator CheB